MQEREGEKGGGVEHNITKEECHRDGGHRDGHRDRDAVLLLLRSPPLSSLRQL